MEHKAVHTDLLVPRDADSLNQAILVANGSQGRHEPAIAVVSLAHVVGGGAFDEELGLVENVLSWETR